MEKEKFDTCKHAKRTGNFAVYTKPTCKQATMIRGRLVVSKARLKRDKFVESECILSDIHQGYNAGLNRAIEIVKGGGTE